jgi:hypothetical protein
MTKPSKKTSLPPRLQKKSKQGKAVQKLNQTLKQIPVKEAIKPDGLLSALEDKARDFVKPSAKPQKLAVGGVAKIRLKQSTSSGKPKKG